MDHRQLLAEVASIRRKTHADLNGDAWRWLSVWAAVSFGFLLTLAIPAWSDVARWYWMIGVPFGMIGTGVVEYVDPTSDRRVRRREWPYWATGAGIAALISGGATVLPGAWILVWIWIVLAGGFAVLLRLDGEPHAARRMWVMSAGFGVIGLIAREPVGASIVCGSVFVIGLLGTAWASHLKSKA
jgi:hypothetical protein